MRTLPGVEDMVVTPVEQPDGSRRFSPEVEQVLPSGS